AHGAVKTENVLTGTLVVEGVGERIHDGLASLSGSDDGRAIGEHGRRAALLPCGARLGGHDLIAVRDFVETVPVARVIRGRLLGFGVARTRKIFKWYKATSLQGEEVGGVGP